jgi:hypothetical protein
MLGVMSSGFVVGFSDMDRPPVVAGWSRDRGDLSHNLWPYFSFCKMLISPCAINGVVVSSAAQWYM